MATKPMERMLLALMLNEVLALLVDGASKTDLKAAQLKLSRLINALQIPD